MIPAQSEELKLEHLVVLDSSALVKVLDAVWSSIRTLEAQVQKIEQASPAAGCAVSKMRGRLNCATRCHCACVSQDHQSVTY